MVNSSPIKLLPTDDPVAFRRCLSRWFKANARSLPWRENRSPYYVVVSEFMLQQTQVKTVIPYYTRWMKQFPDWQALARAKEDRVLKAWEGLGYYSRARNLHRLAKTVTSEHGSLFPDDPAAMQKLPGIGPYTAGAVASLAFGQSVPLLDGNVERVFARLFHIRSDIKSPSNQKKLWQLAETLLPKRNAGAFNEALMEMGALVCTPKSPQCLICPAQKFCTAPNPENLPVRIRAKAIKLDLTYALITQGNKIWLLNPEEPGRWKGFHRLPELNLKQMAKGSKIGSHRFGITKYRITADIRRAEWNKKPPTSGKWHDIRTLSDIALPVPIRKMLSMGLTQD
ncbi:MAG: A/G-specific adenine glycosylase [Verrucomicrobiota bacterium]